MPAGLTRPCLRALVAQCHCAEKSTAIRERRGHLFEFSHSSADRQSCIDGCGCRCGEKSPCSHRCSSDSGRRYTLCTGRGVDGSHHGGRSETPTGSGLAKQPIGMDSANACLPSFVADDNRRFAVAPKEPGDAHVRYRGARDALARIPVGTGEQNVIQEPLLPARQRPAAK